MMLPQQIPQYFDRTLRIRGVDVMLRVFTNNTFAFSAGRALSETEKQMILKYLKEEGFLDNPITGESATNATIA